MKEFIDEIEGEVQGTDINRRNLMAAQGFSKFTFTETDTGFTIVNDFGNGNTETLSVSSAGGKITEKYTGTEEITMVTRKTNVGYEVTLQ